MCQYDTAESAERHGSDQSAISVTANAIDDLINPFQSRTGLGLLARNLNINTYMPESDSPSSSEQTPLEIEETPITSLDTKQGEGDPSLRKKRRNRNSLRIREDISDTAKTDSLKTSGTTTILT